MKAFTNFAGGTVDIPTGPSICQTGHQYKVIKRLREQHQNKPGKPTVDIIIAIKTPWASIKPLGYYAAQCKIGPDKQPWQTLITSKSLIDLGKPATIKDLLDLAKSQMAVDLGSAAAYTYKKSLGKLSLEASDLENVCGSVPFKFLHGIDLRIVYIYPMLTDTSEISLQVHPSRKNLASKATPTCLSGKKLVDKWIAARCKQSPDTELVFTTVTKALEYVNKNILTPQRNEDVETHELVKIVKGSPPNLRGSMSFPPKHTKKKRKLSYAIR